MRLKKTQILVGATGGTIGLGPVAEKMNVLRVTAVSLSCFLFSCSSLPIQGLPGSSYPYPSTPSTPSTQAASSPLPSGTPTQSSGGERAQYVWDRIMEGVAMGGAIGGPYGAGGGLIIGLIAGLMTADSHFQKMNARVQAEQAKDRDLEAQIERELANQRDLDTQIAKVDGGASQPQQNSGTSQPKQSGAPVAQSSTKMPENQGVAKMPENNQKSGSGSAPESVASVKTQTTQPAAPSTPFRNVEVRDVNKDGVPDLWIYYNPARPGEIIRQEEDTNGDGRVDTWSVFKDGKLVRREVDTKGDGTPTVFYIYDKDVIVREERDEHGDGRRSYRGFYENGRLAKVEKDTDGDGKIDLWIYYDSSRDGNVVIKEEADLNSDGAIDLWTFYENGKVVRRDVSAAGMEVLSKQGKGFALPAESTGNQVVKNDSPAVR